MIKDLSTSYKGFKKNVYLIERYVIVSLEGGASILTLKNVDLRKIKIGYTSVCLNLLPGLPYHHSVAVEA